MSQIGNPFSYLLATFDPRMFFGRKSDIIPILQGLSSRNHSSFAIHGIRTIGKTSLLKYLCDPQGAVAHYEPVLSHYGPGRNGKLHFCYLDFYIMGPDVVYGLYRGLLNCDEVRRVTGLSSVADADEVAKPEIKKLLENVLQTLYREGVKLVVCMDHLDSAVESMEVEDEVFLRYLATTYVSFVISTERTLYELKEARLISSPFLNLFVPRNIGLLDESEARELVRVVSDEGGSPFTEDEIDFLLGAAGRQPYLLIMACERYFQLRSEHPEVKDRVAREIKVQQQVISSIEAWPAVAELLSLLWKMLNEYEQNVLLRVAVGEHANLESQQPILNRLRQKALIYEDLQQGKPHIFSELFRQYALRQRQPVRTGRIEEIKSSLAPLDRKLLDYLLARPNQLCTFEELLAEVWGDPNASKRGLEAAVHRLRRRIQDIDMTGSHRIQNVRGKGYQYTPGST